MSDLSARPSHFAQQSFNVNGVLVRGLDDTLYWGIQDFKPYFWHLSIHRNYLDYSNKREFRPLSIVA